MLESLPPRGQGPRSRPPKTRIVPSSAQGAPSKALAGDRLILDSTLSDPDRKPVTSRPTPIKPEGNLDYYRDRQQDFVSRFPGATPPAYYMVYGDVYVRRFTLELSPELSAKGQEWMVRARKNLQVAIEAELARNPELELHDQAFTAFAYATHSRAYLDAGLSGLPIDDLIRIAVTPDLRDTLNPTGLAVIAETAEVIARDKLAAALDEPKETAQEILNALKTSPDLMRDVFNLLATHNNARTLFGGMVKLGTWPAKTTLALMDRLWTLTTEQLADSIEALRRLQPSFQASR